jgi:hypothetical protein
VLRSAAFLFLLTGLLTAGCSIDRVEWESSGFPVEEVQHALEEEHHAQDPSVECIQREAQGAEWECRAHTADAEFHCHLTANWPRERIYELHCETAHAEESGPESEEHGDAEPTTTGEHAEDEASSGTDTGSHEETETTHE